MYGFEYVKPGSVDQAAGIVKADDDAKLLAGGMTLLPTMKQRLAQPSKIVDLAGIPGLTGIRVDGNLLLIGAMTRHFDVANSTDVKSRLPALASLAAGIGDVQVRHRGTMGGSVANNDPAADYPAGVLGLNAIVRTDRREIAADDYFVGMFETALQPGEIIKEIAFPLTWQSASYKKFRHPVSRYAMAGVLVARGPAGIRVAVTGAGNGVFRSAVLEQALTADFSPEALDKIELDPADFGADIHASSEYRAHLTKVMAQDAVAQILGR
jgi:carbon-monoxide dehydrogenase medium subunit